MHHTSTLTASDKEYPFNSKVIKDFQEQFVRSVKEDTIWTTTPLAIGITMKYHSNQNKRK